MAAGADDWRRQGQERYLRGVKLTLAPYTQYSQTWDHEHCEFCGDKFSFAPDSRHEGYTTVDRYRWICAECFNDFKDEFQWTLVDFSVPQAPIVFVEGYDVHFFASQKEAEEFFEPWQFEPGRPRTTVYDSLGRELTLRAVGNVVVIDSTAGRDGAEELTKSLREHLAYTGKMPVAEQPRDLPGLIDAFVELGYIVPPPSSFRDFFRVFGRWLESLFR